MSTASVETLDRWHGTTTGYAYGCRCDECKAAKSADMRAYRVEHPQDNTSAYAKARNYEAQLRREERGLPDPNDSRHGTVNGYAKWGCRCDPCRTAANAYKRHRRQVKRAKAEQSC
jgi:hypothetical protein